jgi:hypothetical protein
MVDGMDHQPHLGTPIANMLGPGDLDIIEVKSFPVTSTLYGMNAINDWQISPPGPVREQSLASTKLSEQNQRNGWC